VCARERVWVRVFVCLCVMCVFLSCVCVRVCVCVCVSECMSECTCVCVCVLGCPPTEAPPALFLIFSPALHTFPPPSLGNPSSNLQVAATGPLNLIAAVRKLAGQKRQ
jgi:hypothetical protein